MAIVIGRRLDLKGLACPAPVERTAAALRELGPGELVEVLTTDPRSLRDFATWSRSSGNALLEASQLGNVFRFVIRRT